MPETDDTPDLEHVAALVAQFDRLEAMLCDLAERAPYAPYKLVVDTLELAMLIRKQVLK